jgi:hypothetical protein
MKLHDWNDSVVSDQTQPVQTSSGSASKFFFQVDLLLNSISTSCKSPKLWLPGSKNLGGSSATLVFNAAETKAENEMTRPRRMIAFRDFFNFSAKTIQSTRSFRTFETLGTTTERSPIFLSTCLLAPLPDVSFKTKIAGNTVNVSARLHTTQSPMNVPNVLTG